MKNINRTFALGLLGVAFASALPASAKSNRDDVKDARRDVKEARKDVREDAKDLRRADTPGQRREAREDLRDSQRDLRSSQRDLREERRESGRPNSGYRPGTSYRPGTVYRPGYGSGYRPSTNRPVYQNTFRTLDGIVTSDLRGNDFVVRLNNGQTVRVVAVRGESRRISRGDRVRVSGRFTGSSFQASSVNITRNR